jgi:2-polyprenyl-3-methyl-5-hydroxy-6-metoxy-1,4-benzoquinol methylase
MGRFADGTGPGVFDEAQAKSYAAAIDIETEFLHDRIFLDILRHHAHGAALDLGGGMGRYAAWLLHMGLATSAHVIDKRPPMIDDCLRRGLPGLSAHVDDIETADLGRAQYDIVLSRFVLMHIRDLEGILNHIVLSMEDNGTLVVVTNIIEETSAAMTTFTGETSRIIKLILEAKGGPILVFNYIRTQEEYTNAVQYAGCRIEFCETYAPQILRLANEHSGMTLSHVVLMGKKDGHV